MKLDSNNPNDIDCINYKSRTIDANNCRYI